jgi:mannose-6-phosphate isomerase-like protein (cupin superfamily)
VKEGGPPLHYHFYQDEYWYILQGEFIFKVGEQSFHAQAGDTVFGPRMVPHAFAKTGEGEGKILMIFQPAGKMEDMFRRISEGETKNMTEEEQDKFREEHGIKHVGPPLTNLKKW